MAGNGQHGHDRVGSLALEEGEARVDRLRLAQGVRRLEETDGVEALVPLLEPHHRMLDHRQARRVVGRQLHRPQERDFEPARAAGACNLLVVGRKDDAGQAPGGERGLGRVGEQGPAQERSDVLARDPLRPPPRRDYSQHPHHAVPTAMANSS